MGHWHDIGQLKSVALSEFKVHAERILRLEGKRGSLARLFITEPLRGNWGETRDDLPSHVMHALATTLDPQPGFQLTDQGWQAAQRPEYPEIQQALASGMVKFLVGTRPDGIRTVAIILLETNPRTPSGDRWLRRELADPNPKRVKREKGNGTIRFFAGVLAQIALTLLAMSLFPRPPDLDTGHPVDAVIAQQLIEQRQREQSAWLLFIVIVGFVSIAPSLWLQTALLTGRVGLNVILTTVPFLWRTKRGIATGCCLLAFAYLMIFERQALEAAFPYGPAQSCVVGLGAVILVLRPPVVLVLCSSSEISAVLMSAVNQALFPHRSVALLDERQTGGMIWSSQVDNLRTTRLHDWKDLVTTLMDLVPIVVVDTRVATAGVVEETAWMLEPTRVGKAIFIVAPDGESPCLDMNRDTASTVRLRVTTEDDIAEVISHGLSLISNATMEWLLPLAGLATSVVAVGILFVGIQPIALTSVAVWGWFIGAMISFHGGLSLRKTRPYLTVGLILGAFLVGFGGMYYLRLA